jgi:hypothetical protein
MDKKQAITREEMLRELADWMGVREDPNPNEDWFTVQEFAEAIGMNKDTAYRNLSIQVEKGELEYRKGRSCGWYRRKVN